VIFPKPTESEWSQRSSADKKAMVRVIFAKKKSFFVKCTTKSLIIYSLNSVKSSARKCATSRYIFLSKVSFNNIFKKVSLSLSAYVLNYLSLCGTDMLKETAIGIQTILDNSNVYSHIIVWQAHLIGNSHTRRRILSY
jgi:hypothetical protein